MTLYLLPLLAVAAAPLPGAGAAPAERVGLEVRETAGIRRFGYPVSAELDLGRELPASCRFRLLLDGMPVPAQFRPLEPATGIPRNVALDFEVSFLPFEVRRYSVEYGPGAQAGPEPERGLKLEETSLDYRVLNGELAFTIRKDLEGFLYSVATPSGDFLKHGSAGASARDPSGNLFSLWFNSLSLSSRVVKSGPLAVCLRFVDIHGVLMTTAEIEIPRSKSWAQVTLETEDHFGAVAGFEVELGLNLAAERTLADFGAAGLVYAALPPGQAALFRAGFPATGAAEAEKPFWEVLRGPPQKLEPYVEGPRTRPATPLEGWAHAMDRDRCTAVAVKDFARAGEDRLEVTAGRGLRITRVFPPPLASEKKKSLVFWLHFVSMPPHVGAVTSPESMASPLETRWIRE